tara:strand:- start:43 stop:684 length:642 start_codon:yes stop_codon:yes gene_type:complete
MFNFMYGPVGDVMSPDFIEQLQASRKQFEFNALKEKYKKPEGSAEYDFSGDREQLAQNMKDLGFVDNNPMTMEAMTSKYSGFLDDLYGVPEIGGSIQGGSIPGVDNRVDFLGRVIEPNTPTQRIRDGLGIRPPEIAPATIPDSNAGSASGVRPGIEALMPAEEEGYKKYIASDTNPFESMGISSLGQDALKQMIFERNNPQANQSRGYKSYIG